MTVCVRRVASCACKLDSSSHLPRPDQRTDLLPEDRLQHGARIGAEPLSVPRRALRAEVADHLDAGRRRALDERRGRRCAAARAAAGLPPARRRAASRRRPPPAPRTPRASATSAARGRRRAPRGARPPCRRALESARRSAPRSRASRRRSSRAAPPPSSSAAVRARAKRLRRRRRRRRGAVVITDALERGEAARDERGARAHDGGTASRERTGPRAYSEERCRLVRRLAEPAAARRRGRACTRRGELRGEWREESLRLRVRRRAIRSGAGRVAAATAAATRLLRVRAPSTTGFTDEIEADGRPRALRVVVATRRGVDRAGPRQAGAGAVGVERRAGAQDGRQVGDLFGRRAAG